VHDTPNPFGDLETALQAALDEPEPARRSRKRAIAKSSLWQTASGDWHFRFRDGRDAEGKWRRPTVNLGRFPTRAAAAAEARRILAGRRATRRAETASPGWLDYSARYCRERLPYLRRETRTTTKSVITRHLDPRFGRLKLHQVGDAIQAWIDEMVNTDPPVPLSTVRHRVGILKTMLNAAAEAGLAVALPGRVRYPTGSRRKRSHQVLTFTVDEQALLLKRAEFPLRAALALGFYLGLRPGEIAGLEWRLIDFTAERIRIEQQLGRDGTLLPTKTAGSATVLAMPDALVTILRAFRTRGAHRYVFEGETGAPLGLPQLRVRQLYPLLERLGLPQRGFHACRRAFADRLVAAGADIRQVQAALRHSTLQWTERYLSPAAPADVAAAIENAARLGADRPGANAKWPTGQINRRLTDSRFRSGDG
jgi:integrase